MRKMFRRDERGYLKRAVSLLAVAGLTCTMALGTVTKPAYAANTEVEPGKGWPENPRPIYETVETIEFGSYIQEDTNKDGDFTEADKTPITWRILSKNDDMSEVLLLSEKVLDLKAAGSGDTSLDNWLTGDFKSKAFSQEEASLIINNEIRLLSVGDIKNTAYRFNADENFRDPLRVAEATAYLKRIDTGTDSVYVRDGTARYHLQWEIQANPPCIGVGGDLMPSYIYDVDKLCGVRPVIKVDLSTKSTTVSNKIIHVSADYDTITFGKDGTSDIKWRVLNVNGNDALVLADKCPGTTLRYNDNSTNKPWKESDLRIWLNGDFYNGAFTDKEKEAIVKTKVDGETEDYVFLLSWEELLKEEYGFPKEMGPYTDSRATGQSYWTRNLEGGGVRCVDEDGSMTMQTSAGYEQHVRPAMHVDLTKLGYLLYDKSDTQSLTYQQGTGQDFTFTVKKVLGSDDSYDQFDSLAIGNQTLKKGTDYTIERGSTIFTVKSTVLDELSTGTHEIEATFKDGVFITTLQITAASATPTEDTGDPAATAATITTTSPPTGDTFDPVLYISLLALALISAPRILTKINHNK